MKIRNLEFKMSKKNKVLSWNNQKLIKLKRIKHVCPQINIKNSPYLQKNKSNTLNSIYKARSTPRTNLSNKITIIEKPTEIDILKDNENVSLSSGQGDDLASITQDHLHISRKNKIKKTPDTLVIIKITYSRTSQL